MLCALSGEQAKEPVLSPKSGAIFEKRLIESYVSSAEKDPINNEPLSIDELIPIKEQLPTIVPPKPPVFNSIPTMLAAFQNEWDALALETFSLRKELHVAKQELSTALYQYDAAVRVAANAMKERDEAQEALRQLSESFAAGEDKIEVDESKTETKEDVPSGNGKEPSREVPEKDLQEAREELFKLHKKEKFSLPVSKTSELGLEEQKTPHEVQDVHSISSGNADGKVFLVANAKIQEFPKLEVFDAQEARDVVVLHSGDAEHTLVAEKSCVRDIRSEHRVDFEKGIVAIKLHPSLPFFVMLAADGTWSLCDMKGVVYTSDSLSCSGAMDIHMDGTLLGVGTESGQVLIFDISTTAQVSSVNAKYAGVRKLQFANNGYWLVVSSLDAESQKAAVQVFDLRKNLLVHEISLDSDADFSIDLSCQVLLTYERESRTLKAHVYVKKGKQWFDNKHVVQTETELRGIVFDWNKDGYAENSVTALGVSPSEVVKYVFTVKY